MQIKEKLLFKSMSGSHLYGTNGENSDKDYKGIFLPNKEDMLLGKYPKQYSYSSSGDDKRNTKDDIDETYYSLQYFLDLLANGETNCLDVFFANSNKEAIIYQDPIWIELTQNADKLITKNINKYLGFCRSQAIKYSIKGEKLDAYNKFKNLIKCYVDKQERDKNGNWITLKDVIYHLTLIQGPEEEYKKNDKVIGKRRKLGNINIFGDHAYIVEMLNKEIYLLISDMLFGFNDSIVVTLHKINKTITQYGKRAKKAASENGADHKALSHAVRVLFQAEELLNTGKIIFPLSKEKTDFVKSIKYNKTDMTYQEIVDYIDNKIKYINETLLPNSKLRDKADYNWIKQFILKLY